MPSMIIACPHCQTRFEVAESRFLPSGRSVRCSECATSWFVPAPQSIETLSPQSKIHPASRPASRPESRPELRPGPRHEPAHGSAQNSTREPAHELGHELDREPSAEQGRGRGAAPHPRESRADMVDRFVHTSNTHRDTAYDDQARPRQRNAPHHNHHPRDPKRRASDQVVDTDWQEIAGAKNYRGPERRGVEQDSLRPTIKRLADDDPAASTIDRIHKARQKGIHDAPGEVFAAIKVQPRELERALKRVRRKAEAREKNRLTPMRVLGWMTLGCLTAGMLFSGYYYRDDVMRMFPGTAKAYARLGIDAKPYGLSLENISHKVALSSAGPILMIQGELHNDDQRLIRTPLLQAEALDIKGRLLASWTFAPEQSSVPGGSYASFATRNRAPEGVVEVVLSFAPQQSRTQPWGVTEKERPNR